MESEILNQTMSCVNLVKQALKGNNGKKYIESLKKLIPLVRSASAQEIAALPFSENILSSFYTDQKLMDSVARKEKDQVSMLSTLVIYIECRQEGMPEHSREYMDRVTRLRHVIDNYYGEESQQFCGS